MSENLRYATTALLSAVIILLLWGCLAAMNRRTKRICGAIELQIAPIKDIAAAVDSKHQRVKAIRKQLTGRGQITQIIEELYKYTPKAISISELKFTVRYDKTHIKLKGQADLLANAFEYADAMSKAELLETIQIINAQQIPRPDGSIVEFEADCVIQTD